VGRMLQKDVIPHLKSIKDCPLFSQPNNSIVENMIQEDPEKRSHLSEIVHNFTTSYTNN